MPPIPELNPNVRVEDGVYEVRAEQLVALPSKRLGARRGAASQDDDAVQRALDRLFAGV